MMTKYESSMNNVHYFNAWIYANSEYILLYCVKKLKGCSSVY